MPADPMITWQLPLAQANFILAVLSKQPLDQVLDVWSDLRGQLGAQLAKLQQQQAQVPQMSQIPMPPVMQPADGARPA